MWHLPVGFAVCCLGEGGGDMCPARVTLNLCPRGRGEGKQSLLGETEAQLCWRRLSPANREARLFCLTFMFRVKETAKLP